MHIYIIPFSQYTNIHVHPVYSPVLLVHFGQLIKKPVCGGPAAAMFRGRGRSEGRRGGHFALQIEPADGPPRKATRRSHRLRNA